jgi:hypothetical protein
VEDRGEHGTFGRTNIGELNLKLDVIFAARLLPVCLLNFTTGFDVGAARSCVASGLELNPLSTAILRQHRSTRHNK